MTYTYRETEYLKHSCFKVVFFTLLQINFFITSQHQLIKQNTKEDKTRKGVGLTDKT